MYTRQPNEPVEEISIHLGNEDELRDFYETRFRSLQQIPCKSIAKDWIKAIEPRKQTLHPYNGGERAKGLDKSKVDVGELCKPEWWPPTGCRHREPDHISRQERLVLLMHLLRNLWDPDIKEGYRSIRVERLRASTMETVASWGNQEAYRHNKMILEGIYNMRQAEERLRNNETDASEHISCPTIPRTLYASRKPKKVAGTKRSFDDTKLDRSDGSSSDGGNEADICGPSARNRANNLQLQPSPRYHQHQGMSFQQPHLPQSGQRSFQDVMPRGSEVERAVGGYQPSSPTHTDPWQRAPGLSDYPQIDTVQHVDSHNMEETSPWQYSVPDSVRFTPHQRRLNQQSPSTLYYAAENSMSPSTASDEMVLSPRGSTHPSSVSSDFLPNQPAQGRMGVRFVGEADAGFLKTEYGWESGFQEASPTQVGGVVLQQQQSQLRPQRQRQHSQHSLEQISPQDCCTNDNATTSPLTMYPDQTSVFKRVSMETPAADTAIFASHVDSMAGAGGGPDFVRQQNWDWSPASDTATTTLWTPPHQQQQGMSGPNIWSL